MTIIKESLKRLWNADEMRILVLVSLCLQFGLVFWSPLRKRTVHKLLFLLLWFFYLFADYVAILALGNLLKRQNEGASGCNGGVGLMAFWAPFLLLHLGGPDTITSYSIEDNELWWRHFLGLAVQVVVAFMVLLELVAIPMLRVAAVFVFIAGLVKYSERTWALRSSSLDQLRKSILKPGAYAAKRKEALDLMYESTRLMRAPGINYNNDRDQIVEAYKLFKTKIPSMVGYRASYSKLEMSKTYFWNCSVWEAFKVVEIELSFLYDVLHTKAVLFHGLCGCLWRFLSLGMISSAFVLFLMSEKRVYVKADIKISYVLFGSALFMELISLLLIISDWMIVPLKENKHSPLKNQTVIVKFMSCFSPKRWSNSMRQYNLLSSSLGDKETKIRWILGAVRVKELWDNFIFIHPVRVPSELEDLLFKELKTKSQNAPPDDFKLLRRCKGEIVLQLEECNHLRWSIDKEFDESVLLWHIATDLCFHTDGHGRNGNKSDISLIMSNYMVYLLIKKPSIMPDGIGKLRFKDTSAHVKKIFKREANFGLTEEGARKALLDKEIPSEKEERMLSLLSDACHLAKDLTKLAEDKRWRLISKVWVEMLGYAAIHCKPYYHAKQLSQGGELLSHVSLLMAHMGFIKQYRWDQDTISQFLLP